MTITTAACHCLLSVGALLWWPTMFTLSVTCIRSYWSDMQIILPGDSGFYRQLVVHWCARRGVDYLVGIARNSRLQALLKPLWK